MAIKRRRYRGHMWHGWAFYEGGREGLGMCQWAEPKKPTTKPSPDGKWVRVRFVQVKAR